jgi:hypothetical protein
MYSMFDGYMGCYGVFVYDSTFSNTNYYLDSRSVPNVDVVTPNVTTFNDVISYPVYTDLVAAFTDNTMAFAELYNPSYTIVYNYVTFDVTGNIILNGNIPYNNQLKYRMQPGIYVFNAIGSYMTVLNKNKEDYIKSMGSVSSLNVASDGNTYRYYGNVLVVYVYRPFGTITFEVFNQRPALYALMYTNF